MLVRNFVSFSQDFGVGEALGWRERKTRAESQVVGIGVTARKPISPKQAGHSPRDLLQGQAKVQVNPDPPTSLSMTHPQISGAVPSWPSLSHQSFFFSH